MRYIFILFVFFFACTSDKSAKNTVPSKVEIVQSNDKYHLTMNGERYQVKGVGMSFKEGNYFQLLHEAGGNSIRTWNTRNLDQVLDSAVKYNFTVAVGLGIKKELDGFDYNDSIAVNEQIARLKLEVDRYKNHPNVLCWVAGNELNLLFDEAGALKLVNPKTYIALSELVEYIHEVDPNHPVTTTFAGANKSHIDLALKYCPDLDFISVQVYEELLKVPVWVANGVLDRPFMITEYGAIGHWERSATAWGREIEETSAQKAASLANRIRIGIVNDTSGLNIGNYAFLWGQKQERTPTWYGMFNKSGESTARIDEMTKYWTGQYPTNRAPMTDSIKLNQQIAEENIYLNPSAEYVSQVFVRELDGDSLVYEWAIMKEVEVKSQGGAYEKEPETMDVQVISNREGRLTFITPAEEGAYRLFSYAHDGKGKVGNANIPFFVRK